LGVGADTRVTHNTNSETSSLKEWLFHVRTGQ
jgi:hypothetical protein